MTRKTTKRLAVFLLAALTPCIVLAGSWQLRDWIKWHVFHRDYLAWKASGGAMQPGFYELITQDPDRDSLVQGLSYDQIRAELPFLTDGNRHPAGSYKARSRGSGPQEHVLWFKEEDGFDWCVVSDQDGARLELIKG